MTTPTVSRDLLLIGAAVPTFLLDRTAAATGAQRIEPTPPQAVRLHGATRTPAFDNEIAPLLEQEKLDWAFIDSGRRLSDFGLIVFDMDSTLITIECIDELADFAGRKAEVSAITEAAMRGEIDYSESLGRRVAVLAGLDARVLARVFAERLHLSPGVATLLEHVRHAGLRTAILSGGFTYFTERLRIELGFDFATSNRLEIANGRLTGRVIGEVVDATAKAAHLRRLREEFGLQREQVIAVGDGANDLLMMAEAGLSVAFRAKPATRRGADASLSFGGLDRIAALLDAPPLPTALA
ncbi:phosphoserine phosphatase SerB [Rhodocyclus tenuis]|uniref:Phosphoserine phosphatase n=1 Tax=Rhodocyclus gracilis TaxID=2929842 RepID=A0ABX0WMC3_9RHOO|nr:phosphoserine phosphatase SerB [Rhodocyclus gracilis]MRD72878.1 phosphoserine phosphatase SerB [Rhodocyclus gracilis]NJA90083.1 phosphoserine phosphatase SerB [Rhodocyclus gracilis]